MRTTVSSLAHRLARAAVRLKRCRDGIAALEFVLLAPALLMLAFGVMVYSIYFSTLIGVRQAAAEGARAAVAGLSPDERDTLARTRAEAVIGNYGSLMSAGSGAQVALTVPATGQYKVTVSYDMSASPIMQFAGFLPLPSPVVEGSSTVTNGNY